LWLRKGYANLVRVFFPIGRQKRRSMIPNFCFLFYFLVELEMLNKLLLAAKTVLDPPTIVVIVLFILWKV
jgi:hypothetical protein